MRKRFFTAFVVFAFATLAMAQNKFTGHIVDSTGEPLTGASVVIKGTTKGTMVDADGNFNLQDLKPGQTLKISFIGYESQEVKYTGEPLNIVLKEADNALGEAVIVGFGTQKKINATGSVRTINTEAIDGRPISNAVEGLQGVIGGLNITNDGGGELGKKMDINIRGVGTVGDGSNSSPLVLIDGMEGDLSTINPNDIENISVLKDAASASIYGSRAPFGVILVTTKKGKAGRPHINYKGNVRINNPINTPNPVDSYTYALMVNDAFLNAGGAAQFGPVQLANIKGFRDGTLTNSTDLTKPNIYGINAVDGNDWGWNQRSYANTNWYDTFLAKATYSQEHNVSMTGGSENIRYYFSGNYLGQEGMFNYADETFERLTLNGKVSADLTKWAKLTWNSRMISTEGDKPVAMNALFYHNLGRRSPLMPIYMPNGDYNKESLIPALLNGGRNITKNQQWYNQLNMVFEPIENWHINIDLNSRIESPRATRQWNKIAYELPDGSLTDLAVYEGVNNKWEVQPNGNFNIQPAAGTSAYEKGYGRINYFQSNVYTDYDHKWGDHYLKVLVGMQTEKYYTEYSRLATTDVVVDGRPYINPTAENSLVSEKKGRWTNLGIFSRINYNYHDRYMAEVNLRGDGASRFPADKRWGFFPSFSLGWNIAQEAFWQPLAKKGFEYLKFRASYGTLGNQNTTSFYPYYQQMNPTQGSIVLGGNQASILPVYNAFTTNLTWETIENAGAGVDWGFFNNRLTGSFDWYQRTTKNMLGPSISLPAIYGTAAPKMNTAELRTRGWELELSWRDRINADWSYRIAGTLSDYETVITKYDSADGNINGWYTDKKYGDMWGYHVLGIAQNDDEMEQYLAQHSQAAIGTNWGGGDLMYADLNGDGSVDSGASTLTDHGDLQVIGNTTPRFAYSFTGELKWKWIDVRAYFQGIGKRDLFFRNSATFFGFGGGAWQRSLYMEHLDYFRYAGSELGANFDSYYGRLRTDANNIQVSDRFVQNGAYLRLKNLQIGFNLPENTVLKNYITKARLYFSGENLFTWTKLRIYDPEAVGDNNDEYGSGKTYPMYRTWSIGLELNF